MYSLKSFGIRSWCILKKKYIISVCIACFIILLFGGYGYIGYKRMNQYAEDMQYYFDTVLANNAYMSNIPTESSIEIYVNKSRECKNDVEFLHLLKGANELFGDAGHLEPLIPDAFYSRLYLYERAIEEGYLDSDNTLYTDLNQTDILKEYDSISKEFSCDKEKIKAEINENLEEKTVKDNLTFTNIDDTLIIGIKSLGMEYYEKDFETLQEMLGNFKGNRIIFDLRDNYGGEDIYWHGLIKMTSFEDYSLERKSFGRGKILENYLNSNDTDFQMDIKDNEIVLSEKLEIKSDHIYNFDHIYILSNKNTGSSADSFVKFAKQTGYATVAGTEASGSGGDGLSPLTFELPNTHLVVLLESTTTRPRKTKPDITFYGSELEGYVDEIIKYENK